MRDRTRALRDESDGLLEGVSLDERETGYWQIGAQERAVLSLDAATIRIADLYRTARNTRLRTRSCHSCVMLMRGISHRPIRLFIARLVAITDRHKAHEGIIPAS